MPEQIILSALIELVNVTDSANLADFILKLGDEQEEGYFLEVCLEYPEELHVFCDTYPSAPAKLRIEEKYLSDHQKELGKKCRATFGSENIVSP